MRNLIFFVLLLSSSACTAQLSVGGGGSITISSTNTGGGFTLTTTGTSGAATYSGGILNIPQYSGGGVTLFSVGSWPSWLTPSVTNPTTTPALTVTASAIPNAALANFATTVNGQTCTLGSSCTSVNSGTGAQMAWYSSSGQVLSGNAHLTDSGGLLNAGEPISISDGSGTGGASIGTFGTAPTASSSTSTLWADNTASRWKMNNANAGAVIVTGIAAAGTASDCVQLAANGIDAADSGVPCYVPMIGTPASVSANSAAGTGATGGLLAGWSSSDAAGYVTITTGTTPATNAGLFTMTFSHTYAGKPICTLFPADANAAAISPQPWINQASTTTSIFVARNGGTALTASTVYTWGYSCKLP